MDAISLPAAPAARTFDYGSLELHHRTAMELAAARIRDLRSSIQRGLLAIGAELLTVKDRVPHGAFGAWVAGELHITLRAAENYMAAARLVQSVPEPIRETVSLLPPTTLYKLAAPSTPKKVVEEVIQAAEGGAVPPLTTIRQRIDEAAREEREVAKVQKAKPGRTEEEAKKLVARRRADRARDRERQRQEQARVEAEREHAKAELKAIVARLVADHPEVMRQVEAVLGGPASWHLHSLLRAALVEVEARR
jgi:hypothetical protein